MSKRSSLGIDVYREAAELQRIGNRTVRKALERSHRLNVPNVYSHNGAIYYKLPDGWLTTVDPFENRTSRQPTYDKPMKMTSALSAESAECRSRDNQAKDGRSPSLMATLNGFHAGEHEIQDQR